MDTTIISVLATGFGTVLLTVTAMAALVARSIGNLRRHVDQRVDTLAHANQQAHDAISLRIDGLRSELVERIDRQGAQLSGRIDALEVKGASTGEDVAFIKGRLTSQPDD